MTINKAKKINKLESFIVSENEDYFSIVKKIDFNTYGFVCVVSKKGSILGVITDGDIRRIHINKHNTSLDSIFAKHIMNKNFISINNKVLSSKLIDSIFSKNNFLFIPVVDEKNHLVSIIIKNYKGFLLPWDKDSVFIISEIGNNHQGDLKSAFELVRLAKWTGANCVKFQHRNLTELYRSPKNSDEDLGTEYTLDLLNKFSLSKQELFSVFDYALEMNIMPLCTPFDEKALDDLEEYGKLSAYKIASADLTNHSLLLKAVKTEKPILLSTGMATNTEIISAVKLLEDKHADYVLLHCNSTYPAPYKDINLKFINKLKEISNNGIVGYSGHERGIHIPVAAVALGCNVIEKHMTLDKSLEGNDHKVSLLPEEFKTMVENIRSVEKSMIYSENRIISQGELINRENLAKSVVINRNLKVGEIFEASLLSIKSPGKGLPPYRINDIVGKIAKRDFTIGDFIYESDINNEYYKPKKYNFDFKFGIPVRFHDYKQMYSKSNFDLFEFHLSYNDLSIDISQFKKSNLLLVVHAPELFEEDHVLDLASESDDYRKKSINHLKRVVDKTIELRKYFNSSKPTPIIVNCGGFSNDKFFEHDKKKLYDRVKESLDSLKNEMIEFIPQTMPPFPWHFGGQRYHNLFCDPDEIYKFCNETNYRICLDISHTWLYCNFRGISFEKSIKKLKNIVKHIHIADASGVDGEGLQIGEGEIDFNTFAKLYLDHFCDATWIPEIWQGHNNNGEGFWIALSKLENNMKIK